MPAFLPPNPTSTTVTGGLGDPVTRLKLILSGSFTKAAAELREETCRLPHPEAKPPSSIRLRQTPHEFQHGVPNKLSHRAVGERRVSVPGPESWAQRQPLWARSLPTDSILWPPRLLPPEGNQPLPFPSEDPAAGQSQLRPLPAPSLLPATLKEKSPGAGG